MVSCRKFLKMLSASDEELEKIIHKMSEEDAKGLLYRMISFSNNYRKSDPNNFFNDSSIDKFE